MILTLAVVYVPATTGRRSPPPISVILSRRVTPDARYRPQADDGLRVSTFRLGTLFPLSLLPSDHDGRRHLPDAHQHPDGSRLTSRTQRRFIIQDLMAHKSGRGQTNTSDCTRQPDDKQIAKQAPQTLDVPINREFS
jgi:hypothetical protein